MERVIFVIILTYLRYRQIIFFPNLSFFLLFFPEFVLFSFIFLRIFARIYLGSSKRYRCAIYNGKLMFLERVIFGDIDILTLSVDYIFPVFLLFSFIFPRIFARMYLGFVEDINVRYIIRNYVFLERIIFRLILTYLYYPQIISFQCSCFSLLFFPEFSRKFIQIP